LVEEPGSQTAQFLKRIYFGFLDRIFEFVSLSFLEYIGTFLGAFIIYSLFITAEPADIFSRPRAVTLGAIITTNLTSFVGFG